MNKIILRTLIQLRHSRYPYTTNQLILFNFFFNFECLLRFLFILRCLFSLSCFSNYSPLISYTFFYWSYLLGYVDGSGMRCEALCTPDVWVVRRWGCGSLGCVAKGCWALECVAWGRGSLGFVSCWCRAWGFECWDAGAYVEERGAGVAGVKVLGMGVRRWSMGL